THIQGRSLFDVFDDVPDMATNLRRALYGDAFAATVAVRDLVVDTWHAPVCDDRGVITGAVGFAVDVTLRRAGEERHLQKQRMEAVGRLAAGISHDCNNLIAIIGGYAEVVMSSFEPEDERRSDLLEIRKAAERAASLTRQLLVFSRRHPVESTVFDLDLLVGS